MQSRYICVLYISSSLSLSHCALYVSESDVHNAAFSNVVCRFDVLVEMKGGIVRVAAGIQQRHSSGARSARTETHRFTATAWEYSFRSLLTVAAAPPVRRGRSKNEHSRLKSHLFCVWCLLSGCGRSKNVHLTSVGDWVVVCFHHSFVTRYRLFSQL